MYAADLKKLSDQEKEIDALTARQKALAAGEFKACEGYEDYLTASTEQSPGRSTQTLTSARGRPRFHRVPPAARPHLFNNQTLTEQNRHHFLAGTETSKRHR